MIDELNHVCAQTPPTAAQRRAALIADATVLANRTFGREAIAALGGRWEADDKAAGLCFVRGGRTCLLIRWWQHRWCVVDVASDCDVDFAVHPDASPGEAAHQLHAALRMLQIAVANEVAA